MLSITLAAGGLLDLPLVESVLVVVFTVGWGVVLWKGASKRSSAPRPPEGPESTP